MKHEGFRPGRWEVDGQEIICPSAMLSDLRLIAVVHRDNEKGDYAHLIADAPNLLAQRNRLVEIMGRIVNAWGVAASVGDCEASALTPLHNHIRNASILLDEIKGGE